MQGRRVRHFSTWSGFAFVCCRSCCINLILGFIYSQNVHVSSQTASTLPVQLVRPLCPANKFIQWHLVAPFTLLSVGHGHPISPQDEMGPGYCQCPMCMCAFYGSACVFAAKHEVKIIHTHMANVAQLFCPSPHFYPTLVVAAGFGFSRQLIFIFSSRTHIPEPPYRTHPLPPLCGHFVVNKFNNLFRLQ